MVVIARQIDLLIGIHDLRKFFLGTVLRLRIVAILTGNVLNIRTRGVVHVYAEIFLDHDPEFYSIANIFITA